MGDDEGHQGQTGSLRPQQKVVAHRSGRRGRGCGPCRRAPAGSRGAVAREWNSPGLGAREDQEGRFPEGRVRADALVVLQGRQEGRTEASTRNLWTCSLVTWK